MTTPFDNYLEQVAHNDPRVVTAGTIIVAGLITGIILTAFVQYAIVWRSRKETRSQRIKRVYNYKFNKKRELL